MSNSPISLSNKFKPSHYDLSLDADPLKPNFTGILNIHLIKNERNTNNDDSEDYFYIDLNCSDIIPTNGYVLNNDESNSVKDKLKFKLNKSEQKVRISSESLKFCDFNEQEFVIRIHYLGIINKILTFNDFTKGIFKTNYNDPVSGKSNNYIVATHSQPNFARFILPCVDDTSVKASFQLSLNTQVTHNCISNTSIEKEEISAVENKDKSTTNIKKTTFKKTPPMASSIFAFVVGDLDYVETKIQLNSQKDFPIRIYTQKGLQSNGNYALITAAEALPLMEEKFGFDYPLDKLDIVSLPFLTDGGVENWSLINISNDHILLPDSESDDSSSSLSNDIALRNLKNVIRQVVVHEIVHQWVGNTITFDSWDHTWLNEAFATWFSLCILEELNLENDDSDVWAKQTLKELYRVKRLDASSSIQPIITNNVPATSTQDTFKRHSYEKGIFVLRMLSNLFDEKSNDNCNNFIKIVGDFVAEYKFKIFKPIDLWNFIKSHELNVNKYDIPTIMNSWIRTAGYPIIIVKPTEDSKISIEQHRFLYEEQEQELEANGKDSKQKNNADIEDIPYHIPFIIKTTNESTPIIRKVLTDRRAVIDIKPEELITVNTNNIAVSTIKYDLSLYENLAKSISEGKLNHVEQCQIVSDISTLFSEKYQDEDDLIGLYKLLNEGFLSEISNEKISYMALTTTLSLFENLYKSILTINYSKNEKFIKTFKKLFSQLSKKLFAKFNDWDTETLYNLSINNETEELLLRSSIISFDLNSVNSATIAKKIFKNLLHGPKNSVPKELLQPTLTVIANQANQKDYKELLEIVKTPKLIIDHLQRGSTLYDVQTAAFSSIGFVSNNDLRQKTLNYITSNTDKKLIELALLGLKFQPEFYDNLWDWFTRNCDSWTTRAIKNPESPINGFLGNACSLIFEVMSNDEFKNKKLNLFLNSKQKNTVNIYKKIYLSSVNNLKQINKDKLKLNEANEQLENIFQADLKK